MAGISSLQRSGKAGRETPFCEFKRLCKRCFKKIARNDCACEYPDQKKEPVKYLSVRYSMPEELVAFFKKQADDTTVESILAGFYKEKTTISVVIRKSYGRGIKGTSAQ